MKRSQRKAQLQRKRSQKRGQKEAKRRAEVHKWGVPPPTRKVKLNVEAMAALERQRELFRQKFGRDPGPDDPVFFDPDSPDADPAPLTEERVRTEMRKAFLAAGTRPELVYATEKTGFLPSEEGYKRMRPEDRAGWDAAIAEYFALEEEAKKREGH